MDPQCIPESGLAELIDNGSLIRSLLDSLTDLVYVKDLDCKYVLTNDAHARFLGAEKVSDLVGKSVFDFFPEELARKYHADDLRVLKTGAEIVDEYEPSIGQEGQPKTILRSKRPLRDPKGRIVGLIGVARDVTERIRTEESLRDMHETLEQQVHERTAAAEQRARELTFQKFALDQSAIVTVTDGNGRITHVNDKFCEISGYSRDELIGHDHRILDPELDSNSSCEAMYATIATGKVWRGEMRSRAKDGSTYWVDATLVPIVDERRGNRVDGYVAIRQDVTQHKEAEEALRQRTCELEAAIDLAERSNRETGFQKFALDQHAIVAVTDARGRITYVNDKFCEISKYSRDELIGQDHRIVNSGMHSKQFFTQMYNTIAHGNVWHGEIQNRAKDGSLYWVDTTIVPIQSEPGGRITGYVAIRADITALKRTQEHLLAAKEAAEAASHAKGEFLANMSHEIRTPMTAIIGYADLLGDTDRPVEERQEFVQTIRRNGEHLLSLINDLLDLSKVEAGKLQMEAVPCNLRQLVGEIESCLRPRAESKGVELRVQYEPRVPNAIQTDPTRLRQVLLNLASNAIKFTETGSVQLRVSWKAQQKTLRFDVIDTGIGLTPDQQAAIFRPFAQADSSTTRRFGGTGLGLSLSKRLVEMLGGQLTVSSQYSKGSTFSFTVKDRTSGLRRSSKSANTELNISTDALADLPGAQRLSGRVLLVEDGADNRRLVMIYLQSAGLSVASAENGQYAIDMVTAANDRGDPYDLILMDMQMPVMDGYHATAELRRLGFVNIPIVAFTAHALEGERQKCLDAGCDDYSTKPVNPEALIRTIGKLLNRGKSASGASRSPTVGSAPAPAVNEQKSAGADTSPHVNLSGERILRSKYADNKVVSRILPGYIEELPRHVANMQACLESQRLDDLRRLVHQMKGSGGGYGFPELTRLATVAEDSINAKLELQKIQASVVDLCGLIRRVEGYEPSREAA